MKGDVIPCGQCGQDFTKASKNTRFCSTKCVNRFCLLRKRAGNGPGGNLRKELPYAECLWCKAELPHEKKVKEAKYCGRDCYYSYKASDLVQVKTFSCEVCQAEFTAKNSHARSCSGYCQKKAHAEVNAEKIREVARAWRERNRESVREMKRAWRIANRTKVNAQKREWYKNNPDNYEAGVRNRARNSHKWTKPIQNPAAARRNHRIGKYVRKGRIRGNGNFKITKTFERKALQRARWRCTYCDQKFVDTSVKTRLEWDHVVPISRGGANSEGNLVPCCGSCNRSKGKHLIVEWRRRKDIEKRAQCQQQ